MEGSLKKDFYHSLVVLPSPPSELQSKNPFLEFSLVHRRIFRMLLYLKLCGLVIRKQPQLPGSQSVSDQAAQSCLFIPAPDFKKILILLSLETLTDESVINRVIKSIHGQLKLLNETVIEVESETEISPEKLEVQLIGCLPIRELKSEMFKKLKEILHDLITDGFSNIKVEFIFCDKNSFGRKIKFCLNSPAPKSNFKRIQSLQNYYTAKLQHTEEIYHLSPQTELGTFVEETIRLFDSNFSDRFTNLTIIPCLDKLRDDALSAHYVDTDPIDSDISISKKLFSVSLRGICGILIQAFSNKHFETILNRDSAKPQKFEFDWIYLGSKRIVVFQVETSRNPENLQAIIKRRIIQSLTHTVPQLYLIMQCLWESFRQNISFDDNCSFNDFSESVVHNLIFLPGVSYGRFLRAIQTIRESLPKYNDLKGKNDVKRATSEQRFLNVVKLMEPATKFTFMICADSTSEPKLIRVDKRFQIIDEFGLEEQLFDLTVNNSKNNYQATSRSADGMATKQQFVTYVSSLLSTASLNYFKDLDHNQRAPVSIREWKELQIARKFDLNLNRQQREILSEKANTHLIITGESRADKTTLLLAKCEQFAKERNVEKILLFYDHSGKVLRRYLEDIRKTKSILLLTGTKFEVKRIEDFDSTVSTVINLIFSL